MKNMFKAFLLFTTVLFFSCASNAQEKTIQMATMVTDTLKAQLSLTDVQYKKAYDANLAFINSAKAAKQSDGGRREKAKALKAADAKRDEAMKGILDAKQYGLYLEKKKENREKLRDAAQKRRNG
ncbi:MAG: hypothetical protein ACLGH8_04455 [Bacteroidia bacterium]